MAATTTALPCMAHHASMALSCHAATTFHWHAMPLPALPCLPCHTNACPCPSAMPLTKGQSIVGPCQFPACIPLPCPSMACHAIALPWPMEVKYANVCTKAIQDAQCKNGEYIVHQHQSEFPVNETGGCRTHMLRLQLIGSLADECQQDQTMDMFLECSTSGYGWLWDVLQGVAVVQ